MRLRAVATAMRQSGSRASKPILPARRKENIMDRKEWLDRYQKRMLDAGLDNEEARAVIESTIYADDPLDDDPEQAADDELSYMADS